MGSTYREPNGLLRRRAPPIRLVATLRETFHVELTMQSVFENPTISQLSDVVLESLVTGEDDETLDKLLSVHQVRYEHVKGHAGHLENERCDQLAVAAYQRYLEKS